MTVEGTAIAAFTADRQALLRRLLAQKGVEGSRDASIPRRAADLLERAPLSFAQQRLWVLDRLEPGSAHYNVPLAVRLCGALDVAALAASVGEIARRHEALRTTFGEAGGEPVQEVAPAVPVRLPAIDLAALPPRPRRRELDRLAAAEAARPFDLARGPVFRTTLVRLAAAEHAFLLTLHHIASDGWSSGVFVREMQALYSAFSAGRPSPLPELPLQYADFAVWQRQWLAGRVLEEQLAWWRLRLAGAPEALDLPTDRPRPAVPTSAGARRLLYFPAATSAALGALCRERGTTPFVVLLAVWARLLAAAAGTDDLVLGSTIANRNRQELEGLIGFFVNALALRLDLAGDPTFAELLGRVKDVTHGAFTHQDLPFERLVEDLRPGRETGRNPLFQVMFNLLNTPLASAEEGGAGLASLNLEPMPLGTPTAKFDLTLSLGEDDSTWAAELEYATDLFDAPTILRLGERFLLLVEAAVADPGRRLSELPLLAVPERHQLTREWGIGAPAAGGLECLHALFEAQVARNPEAVALAAGDLELTYGELDRRAEALAAALRTLGVGPEERVGLCCRRTPALVVGLLAVLKAGGAYVPLDPTYPPARLERILRVAEPRVVLVGEGVAGVLPAGEWVVREIEDGSPGGWQPGKGAAAGAENLAYLIFTSGSTGEPKGVAIRHGGAVAMVRWALETFGAAELRGVLFSTSINFDISVFELFAPLACGGTAILVDDALGLQELARPERVTLIDTVPSAGAELLRAGAIPGSVRTVNLAGEALPRELADGLGRLPHAPRVLNLYGPTEDTTYSTWAVVPAGERRPPAIGRILSGSWVVVLDRDLAPVPLGIPGEVFLGGAGLARGYFRRPELTAERFLPAPVALFGEAPGARAYRTGDLARFRPDGQLEFLGRRDHQVKIRGFRIELADIELALGSHRQVRECAVLARGDGGERRLAAYVVPEAEGPPDAGELRAHLEALLPAYMVPQAYAFLPAFPRTASGKVDRRALSQVTAESPTARRGGYVVPRGPVEEVLAGIFGEVLGLDPGGVGGADSFFDLGGHSLLAMRALSRVRDSFGVDFPLRALFEDPSVAAFAGRVEGARRAGGRAALPPVTPVPRGRPLPLSFAQERMWFMDRMEGGTPIYNVPEVEHLRGRLDPVLLSRSFQAIVDRHEVLRTAIEERGGRPVQVIAPHREVWVPRVDLAALPAGRRRAEGEAVAWEEAWRPFDLASGRVIRALVIDLSADEHIVVLTRHHIVSDGWSMELLDRELSALYAAFERGEEPALPALPVQYADFACWQRDWLQGEVEAAQLAFWQAELAGLPPLLELPTDRPRPEIQTFRGELRAYTADPETMGRLRAFSQREGASLFMTLLAAYGVLLGRLAGRDDIPVGTPIANRGRAELEGVVGFFANTLVLRLDLAGDPSFRELVARVRAKALAAYDHQDLPFERLVEELQPSRSLSYQPLFQVMFVQQNRPEGAVPVPREGIFPAGGRIEGRRAMARFDLELYAIDFFAGTEMVVEFNADLFDSVRMLRLLGHWRTLLGGALDGADLPISELPWLTPPERHQLLAEWGTGAGTAAPPARVSDLFLRQAAATPAALAVTLGSEGLTYAELAARSGRLARRLAELGAGPERRVGLAVRRSLHLPVGVLGVLRAGAAYVPLDPAYPQERLALMIADAGLTILLAERELAASLSSAVPLLTFEELDLERGAADVPGGPGDAALAESGAYVIYTSGSTGRPKGVVMPHRALVNMASWQLAASRAGAGDVTAQLSAFSFDVSFQEMMATWAAGGTLALVPEAVRRDAGLLLRFLDEQRVARLFLPFVALDQLAQAAVAADAAPRALAEVITAGEALKVTPDLRAFFDRTGARLDNQYGPTESHVVTAGWLGAEVEAWPLLPSIGRPIAGIRVWVQDAAGYPAPAGVPGELALGGAGLARGYLDRPEETARKFVPDPASGEPGARLYRSGDLGRFDAAGDLEFLGRIDQQVKVRGFRIEPGEVEAALARQPGVARAVVVARGLGAARGLVAFLVAADPAAPPAPAALAAALAAELPEPSVPGRFEVVEAFPRTPSGKVDRKALAERPLAAIETVAAHVPPATPLEEIVAGIWAEVLELPRVSVTADFFALGGHSLLATQVQSRLRRALGLEIPLRRLFERPTIRELARDLVPGLPESGAYVPIAPLPAAVRRQGVPLSFAQQRLWFFDQLEPGNPSYNLPVVLRLAGDLKPAALAAALSAVVARHEVLSTRFVEVGGEPRQVVDPPAAVPLPVADLSRLPAGVREGEAARLAAAFASRPFDLARGPVLRAALLALGEGSWDALFAVHHIVSDGWSTGVLVGELGELYRAALLGAAPRLPPLPLQYADFAVWQRQWLDGERLLAQLGYWRERLAGLPPVGLPADRPRPAVLPVPRRGGGRAVRLDGPAVAGLAHRLGATPFMVLAAAVSALIARATGEGDVGLGTAIAGRNRPELERLIGFFVNTLVLRTDLAGDPGFDRLVGRVRERAFEAYAHQDVPFERLVEELVERRDPARTPLVSLLLGLENTPGGALELPGVTLAARPLAAWTARYDLILAFTPLAEELAGAAEYDADLFDDATIGRLLGHLATLVAGAAADPGRPLSALPLLAEGERHQLAVEWNDTARVLPGPALAVERISQWAATAPAAPAVVWDGGSFSYGELWRRSGLWAAALRARGAAAERRVGIALAPSPVQVVAVLAVLRAGGVCLPLDPTWPAERLAFMLADSEVSLLIGDGDLPPELAAGDVVTPAELDAFPDAEEGLPAADPLQLAYVIFTSGSTGRPKGVAVAHLGLVNLMEEHGARLAVGPGDRLLLYSSWSFDMAFLEALVGLGAGAALAFVDRTRVLPGEEMARLMARLRVTRLICTPSTLAALPEALLPELRGVAVGGEPPAPELVARWLPGRRVLDIYGPTETTMVVASGECCPGQRRLHFGRPFANLRAFVLDARGELAPVGVPGELHLGGIGVARGYQARPELTAERFVPDPFVSAPLGAAPGGRLYKSGDLVRQTPAGELEFVGRTDGQIKLRGFRIELGEVERALYGHPGVAEAVVVAVGGRLVGFVRGDEEGPADGGRDEGWRAWLRGRLPEFMVPARVRWVSDWPLNPSGKIDRPLLARWAAEGPAAAVERALAGPVEEGIAALWSAILGVEVRDAEADFFALGGHSLLAAQAVSRVSEAFAVQVPLRILFECPTVATLAAAVEELCRQGRPAPAPVAALERPARLPLTFAQERLWFVYRLDRESPAYDVPISFRVAGPLSAAALAAALAAVAARHEGLRTTFAEEAGEPCQRIAPPAPVPLPVIDLARLDGGAQRAEAARLARADAHRPFVLETGPVMRFHLLRFAADDHQVIANFHHIAFDGWSATVLRDEIGAFYRAARTGEAAALPPLPRQLADIALWQHRRLADGELAADLAAWRRLLGGELPVLRLPFDRPRPEMPSYRGGVVAAALPAGLAAGLAALGGAAGATLFMVLLAGLKAFLLRYSSRESVLVGADVAGRDRLEIEGVIGFFVNVLLLHTDLAGDPTLAEVLARVRATTLGGFEHQDVPFDRVVAEVGLDRAPGTGAPFDVAFVLQRAPRGGTAAGEISLSQVPVPIESAKLDLLVMAEEDGVGGLAIHWVYSADVFVRETVERIAAGYLAVLERFVAAPGTHLSALAVPRPERSFAMPSGTPESPVAAGRRGARRRALDLSPESLAAVGDLSPGRPLPGVVLPLVADVAAADWAAENRGLLERELLARGALLFRGFGIAGAAELERLARSLTPELYGEYGDLPRDSVEGKIYTSTPYPPEQAILFHNESSQMHVWPQRQWFCCLVPAASGGETPLADSREMYRRLDPALRRRFARSGLLYVRNFTEGLDVSWREFFRTDDRAQVEEQCRAAGLACRWLDGGGLSTAHRAPAVALHPRTGEAVFFNQILAHHPACLPPEVRASLDALFGRERLPRNVLFGDGEPILDEVVAEIRALYAEIAVTFPWQAGDVMLVDNMLVAHARNPYSGPRKILVAMGEMVRAETVRMPEEA